MSKQKRRPIIQKQFSENAKRVAKRSKVDRGETKDTRRYCMEMYAVRWQSEIGSHAGTNTIVTKPVRIVSPHELPQMN